MWHNVFMGKNWLWKLYGVFLTTYVFGGLRGIFSKNSSFDTYYTILIAFNKYYIVFLALNIISLLINLLAPLVVFYYAFEIKSSLKFWKVLFFVRIVFDLIGHHYELQFMKSSFYQSIPYGLACIGFFVLPILPSYMAHYNYIFKRPLKAPKN